MENYSIEQLEAMSEMLDNMDELKNEGMKIADVFAQFRVKTSEMLVQKYARRIESEQRAMALHKKVIG